MGLHLKQTTCKPESFTYLFTNTHFHSQLFVILALYFYVYNGSGWYKGCILFWNTACAALNSNPHRKTNKEFHNKTNEETDR